MPSKYNLITERAALKDELHLVKTQLQDSKDGRESDKKVYDKTLKSSQEAAENYRERLYSVADETTAAQREFTEALMELAKRLGIYDNYTSVVPQSHWEDDRSKPLYKETRIGSCSCYYYTYSSYTCSYCRNPKYEQVVCGYEKMLVADPDHTVFDVNLLVKDLQQDVSITEAKKRLTPKKSSASRTRS